MAIQNVRIFRVNPFFKRQNYSQQLNGEKWKPKPTYSVSIMVCFE